MFQIRRAMSSKSQVHLFEPNIILIYFEVATSCTRLDIIGTEIRFLSRSKFATPKGKEQNYTSKVWESATHDCIHKS